MTKQRLLPIAAIVALLPNAALAQDGRLDVADGGDTAWLLASCALALLTLSGLALFYSGRVRRKNALSVLVQCGAIFAAVSVLWIIVGYTLAFGEVGNGWLGKGNAWMLINLGNVRAGTSVPESAFALFQMVFAALAPALMAGAWAERARLGWVIAFASLWSLVVYAPVAHWIWGGGWLAQGVGTLDWSGGIVMHTSAGVSAVAVAVMLGRRKGAVPGQVAPHSPTVTVAGGVLLWIGSLALSGGSALAASDDAAAAVIAMHVGAASAALTWLLLERLAAGKPSARGFAIGALAGIVTVSPAAGYISPGAAILFGMAGALACYAAMQFAARTLKIDDALGVFAVHGVGGILGALLLAAFLSERLGGVGYAEGMNPIAQIVAQGVGVAVVTVWSLVGTVILALMASLAFPMRVSEDTEREGLDAAAHGERAWDFD
ncbi:ammonium transporter [Novosphingobium sp. AP12]|uniref:ammonium transporter n=1 Tax=Novosphingobium sp. AP12 TaxID=1144305 RepID=UPI000271E71C|nr:ammonium transporter [Novosphingobium sp. AP12]EJL33333.1 ammonia permease [Novosphingobium sp. AP12]